MLIHAKTRFFAIRPYKSALGPLQIDRTRKLGAMGRIESFTAAIGCSFRPGEGFHKVWLCSGSVDYRQLINQGPHGTPPGGPLGTPPQSLTPPGPKSGLQAPQCRKAQGHKIFIR